MNGQMELERDLIEIFDEEYEKRHLITPANTAEKLTEKGYRKETQGEWIEHDDDWCGAFYTCSVCKCDWVTIDGTPSENNMRYCPECGAYMKGAE
jgi:rubrerythrin